MNKNKKNTKIETNHLVLGNIIIVVLYNATAIVAVGNYYSLFRTSQQVTVSSNRKLRTYNHGRIYGFDAMLRSMFMGTTARYGWIEESPVKTMVHTTARWMDRGIAGYNNGTYNNARNKWLAGYSMVTTTARITPCSHSCILPTRSLFVGSDIAAICKYRCIL